MKIANKNFARTVMTSELCSGDVVGVFLNGEMYYYLYGFDEVTGDNTFINLCTGRVLRDNTEREYYYFPNASFNPLGK